MRRRKWGAVATVGWALMFGKPGTDVTGWKKLDVFDSETSCQQERHQRAQEVRDKTTTNQTVEVVLTFYRCLEVP
jgi:hypothetical protein